MFGFENDSSIKSLFFYFFHKFILSNLSFLMRLIRIGHHFGQMTSRICHEIVWGSQLQQLSSAKYQDAIVIHDGVQPMCDCQHRAVLELRPNRFLMKKM